MDQYLTHEARLASFQKGTKKRASTTGGRSKALNWPHKQIAPESVRAIETNALLATLADSFL
jgi:hypothetical protein